MSEVYKLLQCLLRFYAYEIQLVKYLSSLQSRMICACRE